MVGFKGEAQGGEVKVRARVKGSEWVEVEVRVKGEVKGESRGEG